jgi:hypothetical protein
VKDSPAGSQYLFENIKVDVLFTGTYSGTESITYSSDKTRFYLASLTTIQVDFVKRYSSPVILDCIIGLKKWMKVQEMVGSRPPSSYLLEILVIATSRRSSVPLTRLALFKATLRELINIEKASICWDGKPSLPAPCVQDPANSRNNLLVGLDLKKLSILVRLGVSEATPQWLAS